MPPTTLLAAEPATLLATARARGRQSELPYAGAVTPPEAWALQAAGAARLVDVRTAAEVKYVGRPLHIAHVEWEIGHPQAGERFVERLRAVLGPDQPVLLLCRTGARSHAAATAAAASGYVAAFNVLEGFEGQRDSIGQRGHIDGWRFHGLPWDQD